MKIVDLLAGLNYEFVSGEKDIEINNPQYDSRKVQKGDVFFAITGFSTDGHKFIAKAVENGAKVVIVERDIEQIEGVTYIKVENGRKALAMASCNFYDNPSRKMKLIGITGTNGKTTSAFMIKAILEASGYKVGLIGTIANYIGSEELHAERTTPESLELQELFNKMVEAGVDYCVMEVSSHSLDLYRVYGTKFEEGIFTNLTQDHLDFHKTFENYYKAKAKLFDISKSSIINADDEYGARLIKEVTAKEASKVTTYSIEKVSDLRGEDIDLEATGMIFDLEYKGEIKKVVLSIPGRYNVYNALGCIGAALNQGIDIDVIIKALAMVTVPGRCENLTLGMNSGFQVIRDYSHTPDSLKNILENLRELTTGRLICIFGCGGDRDKTKRPIMGEIGTNLSDIAIITSDNPRSEDPYAILDDIVAGVKQENYKVVENREEAIKEALLMAQKGDIIVIAGKGHETYQILKNETIHFDEKEVVLKLMKELKL
ncbi:MAG: UDP-N-acetylmuramoyl-L-alanyl-D-glutamate--2,6-diaminopimelate ligase [Clostridium sp.]|uniref:UDP-N-acetylmuramoyl-L-alanyl-D-glutamate--2, 6-diaminopimelate ligase n=1 Tax=Clostridium culturomicium TaxID=1499683 RepID=UPI00058C9ADF|nr:UDP-N-acetylmuramoyl-L-alanyl-D-glutamate--2,6-diaminopimelate ligase [Clostridium culturomicium]MDU4892415.1 UDP-N-acetylmuramoyl-L-alanyl-D-glutamate--2,6-diaminopimelate ligase [Clostridium sp.]MDU7084426.1 UDP-N-acetylmuramoyl-L-alanyl-D-glutamate--2,6-diaminopimelate ligase [Clostridium sp.]